MQSISQAAPRSNIRLWAGRIIGAVVVLFMLMDSAIHVLKPQPVVDAFAQLGYPISLAPTLGIIEFFCILFYVIPRTTVLGAILLTGYLGGAVASNVRVGHPLFECIFPIIIGVLLWGAPYLLDGRVRAVFPVRR